MNAKTNETILVLDFGGQYKELIARRVREYEVYSEVKHGWIRADEIKKISPIGIILTGGPNSVYAENSMLCDRGIFDLGIPVLGICYGMQLMCHVLGGEVSECGKSEYGKIAAQLDNQSLLFSDIDSKGDVLMSHTDYVSKLPDGFICTGKTSTCEIAACENTSKNLYAVQFHPETEHTQQGKLIIRNFLFNICRAKADYHLDDYLENQINDIRRRVGNEKILLALSGGVDSSVCAGILSQAVPDKLVCIFVDHGFMRHGEGDEIERIFSKKHLRFIRVNAQERFLKRIKGVSDPEMKRKIVGEEFIRVFEEEAEKLGYIKFLAQGTIYPDVIESGGDKGNNAATIKSHHNVGGLPEDISFQEIIEPLSGLFKDEVRRLGVKLDIPKSLTERQPFPGPGLSIRIIGKVTNKKLSILRHADAILREEIEESGVKTEQYFTVFTGIKTVGVKGDKRTYSYVIAIRAVTTSDFMTCEYTKIPYNVLDRISSRIVNEVKDVSRVVYDVTGKPPATVEWE